MLTSITSPDIPGPIDRNVFRGKDSIVKKMKLKLTCHMREVGLGTDQNSGRESKSRLSEKILRIVLKSLLCRGCLDKCKSAFFSINS